MPQLGRNDPYPCGSGQKYKKCCLPLDERRSARSELASSSQSLKDKNLALLGAMAEIFGLWRPWDKVKNGMTDGQIREFYHFIADLWPVDTDHRYIMPQPDSTLRALYLGENEPELMIENVFHFCLYADQIVLINPFDNPNVMAEKLNPIHHPGEWRLQTLRLVYHLMLLAPWIEAGLVVLIPDPGDFNRQLRVQRWDLAVKRLTRDKGWEISDEDIDRSAAKQRALRMMLLSPRSYLERTAKEACPEMFDGEIQKLLDHVEQERASDPLLPNDTLDRMPGQMTAGRLGGNLEMGLYICQATGAFPYTNVKFRWKEILDASSLEPPNKRVSAAQVQVLGQSRFEICVLDSARRPARVFSFLHAKVVECRRRGPRPL